MVARFDQTKRLTRLTVSEGAGQSRAQTLPTAKRAYPLVRVVSPERKAIKTRAPVVLAGFRVDPHKGITSAFIWTEKAQVLTKKRHGNVTRDETVLWLKITMNAGEKR